MFFFGLFSANIVYVIIAVAYFIGIGSYSLEKLHRKYSPEPSEVNEINCTPFATSNSLNCNFTTVSKNTNEHLFAAAIFFDSANYTKHHKQRRSAIIYIAENSSEYYGYKFSRPPPVS